MRFFFFVMFLICENSFGMEYIVDNHSDTLDKGALSLFYKFSSSEVDLFEKKLKKEENVCPQFKNIKMREEYHNRIDSYNHLLYAAKLLLKVQNPSSRSKEDVGTLSVLAAIGGMVGGLITQQAPKLGIVLEDDPDEFDGF